MTGASSALAAAQSPYWVQGERVWRITRYADVVRLLKHDAVEVLDIAGWLRKLSERAPKPFSNLILLTGNLHPLQNGEAHAKSRARARAFLTELTRNWPPERLHALAEQLLAAAALSADVDAVTDLADAYTATIAASELKMDAATVLACSEIERDLFAVSHFATPQLRHLQALEERAAAMMRLLRQHLPGLASEEFSLVAVLALASVGPPGSLLATSIAFLAHNPALQDRLCTEPELINSFVNEALRHWPPAKRIQGRRTTADIELDGCTIPRGATLVFDLMAAHFDPSAYPGPERFDIRRNGPPLLAFGGGPHMCTGATLARVQVRCFLETLCRNWIVRPAGQPIQTESLDFFEFDSVPVSLAKRER
jgi:nocardicin N-oxygenase